MKNLKGKKYAFTRHSLNRLTEGERKVLYIFPLIQNRSHLYLSQIIGCYNTALDQNKSSLEREIAESCALEFTILLAGEIYEGLQQVKKIFNNRVSQSIGDLPEEIEEIKDDLNDTNKDIKIIQYIRDNISHHRSLKDLPSALDQIDLNQHQTFYRSDPSSNYKNKFFYNFAAKAQEETIVLGVRQVIHSEAMKLTEAANRAKPVTLEQEMKIEDLRTEAEKLTAEARSIDLKKISEKVQEIFRLLSRYMDFIIFTLCAKLNLDRQDVLLSNVPSSSELTSNYFFYSRED